MTQVLLALLKYLLGFIRSRHNLGLEILALRQQLAVFKRWRPRPCLKRCDRLFWVALCSLWDRWIDALIIVKPETVVRWHRAGFRLYWRFRSRVSWLGRRKIEPNVFERAGQAHGRGESILGRAENPWRAVETRL